MVSDVGWHFFTFYFSIVDSSAAPSASPCSQAWSGAHPTARREWNWIPFGGGCKRWSGPWIQTTSSNHNGRPHWVIEGIEIISKTWTSAAAPQPGRWNKKIWLLCDLTLTWGYFLELSLLVTIRSHPIPSIASFSGCPNRNTNCSLVCLQLVPCSTFLKFALALHLSVMFRCLSGETMSLWFGSCYDSFHNKHHWRPSQEQLVSSLGIILEKFITSFVSLFLNLPEDCHSGLHLNKGLSSVIRVRASPMVRWSRKSCFFPWASPRLNSITKWTLTFIQTWLLQAVEITKRYNFPYEILHSMSNFWCWIVVVKLLVFGTSDKRWNQLPANSRRAVHETRDVSAEEDLKSSKHMEHSETTEDSGLAGTQSCSNFDLAMIISLLQSTVIWPCPSSKYSYN